MNDISTKIGRWYDENKRNLPWRDTKDAYRIWLSEIILQQTRVAQGLDYYQRFVERFPTVRELAQASQDEVLKLWQGLGYYSRARNLHAAAQQVCFNEELGVRNYKNSSLLTPSFPTRYADLIKLKGVGPYTAAAIASFSSDEKVAVVDGNVYRVLSRLFDIDTPIDSTQGQKDFLALATQLLPEKHPGHHNQAMMELGALCCTPTSPQCEACPVADHCLALANHTIGQRPVKAGKVKVRERHLHYLIYIYKDMLWVHQRGEGDIWTGLWEYVMSEELGVRSSQPLGRAFLCSWREDEALAEGLKSEEYTSLAKHNNNPDSKQFLTPNSSFLIKHQLTHQTLFADFQVIPVQTKEEAAALDEKLQPMGYKRVTWMEWQELAVPRLIDEANRRIAEAWF